MKSYKSINDFLKARELLLESKVINEYEYNINFGIVTENKWVTFTPRSLVLVPIVEWFQKSFEEYINYEVNQLVINKENLTLRINGEWVGIGSMFAHFKGRGSYEAHTTEFRIDLNFNPHKLNLGYYELI